MRFRYIFITILSTLLFTHVSHSVLLDYKSNNGVVYFLNETPNNVIRYDTLSQSFLDEINLPKTPSAFTIDGDNIYIAYSRELKKISLTDNSSEFIRNTSTNIKEIFTLSNFIYVVETNGNIQVINKLDYSLVQNYDSHSSGQSYIAIEQDNSYFFRTTGSSPSDIRKAIINNTGAVKVETDSPYHGDYPSASKLYVNGSSNKIYDNAGIVYFIADMSYAGSLAGSVDLLTFSNDSAIAARGNKLFLFNPSLLEAGEITLPNTPIYLEADSDNIFSFYLDQLAIKVTISSLNDFNLPSLGDTVDPTTVEFVPESIESDNTDILYFLDRETLSVFRWSLAADKYIATWPLLSPPTWMSYSAEHTRIYLGYPSGKITYFDTTAQTPTETHFTNLALPVKGLLAVEDYLFAADNSGSLNTHYIIDIHGATVSTEDWRNISSQYAYSPLNNRIYHHRDGTSPNDIEWLNFDKNTGVLGSKGNSPYHGNTLITKLPLRINRIGDLIVNGAGQLIDSDSLNIQNNLSNNIKDAAWFENNILITLNDDGSKLQFWNNNYSLDSEYTIQPSAYSRVLNIAGDLAIVTELNGRPSAYLYDLDSLPDSDEDGTHDLKDNCIREKNADQANHDADAYGDLCDEDDDNDGLSDLIEIELGLNPKDALDADSDLDNDGFSNRIESILLSDINDANSIPELITEFNEGFESGWPSMVSNAINLGWALSSDAYQGNAAIMSSVISDGERTSDFHLYSYFDAGSLSFNFKSQGTRYYYYNMNIEVDGIEIKSVSASRDGTWGTESFLLTKGVHKITFKVKLRSNDNTIHPTKFWIDNLAFSPDSDGDGIGDNLDNCPNISNKWQNDSDDDGKGNECDNTPWGQDRDNDDVSDYSDNCPDTYNPDQADLDTDSLGDACDTTDDRPKDSDSDGINDNNDNCPNTYNPDQANLDNDDYGDACDLTDDRPKDSDSDGVYDNYDNCPQTHNPLQGDLDKDARGDACDPDIDGDGILNTVEEQYSALDPYNPKDAHADYDNDGASNGWEVLQGNSPDEVNEYKKFNLLEYFPLGNIERTYGTGENAITLKITPTDIDEEFLLDFNGEYNIILRRQADGIYYIKNDNPNYKQTIICEDYLFLPATMTIGETINTNGTCTFYNDGEKLESMPVGGLFQILGESTFEWEGKTHPTLIFNDFTGGSYELAKDIGDIALGENLLNTLNTYSLDNEYEGKAKSNSNESKSSKSSALGSFDIRFLLLVIMLVLIRFNVPSLKKAH